MTTTTASVLRFAGHYLEMVVAMFVGMFALAPLWDLAFPGLHDHPGAHVMVMATDMAVGMALWMRIRKHGWPHILEMCAAMYVPFVVLLVPYWMDLISSGTLMTWGHILMFPAMLVPMLRHSLHGRRRSAGGVPASAGSRACG